MGKSYKKTPISALTRNKYKNIANRRVRHCKDIPNGKSYKKVFCSWEIKDYICYQPYNDFLKIKEGYKKSFDNTGLSMYNSLYEHYDDFSWFKSFKRK